MPSTACPPYMGGPDGLICVKQTTVQPGGQANVTTLTIPSRVTDLAASSAARPVISWTNASGVPSY